MAKTKTNDQQPHTARERAKTKPCGENGVQRRRPLKWDLRQENLFLATALKLNPVRPDFRAIAEELGTDIVSAATLRKRLPEIFKRASAVLKERRDTSGLFTSHDVQKSPEDRPDKSDTSSESQSPGPSTPPSTMRARQASDKIKSSASSRYALTPHDKYKDRGFPYAARYDTPHTCSPNEDAGSPYTQTSNREYSSSESEEFRGARTFTPSSNNTQFHKRNRSNETRPYASKQNRRNSWRRPSHRGQPRDQNTSPRGARLRREKSHRRKMNDEE